MRTASTNSKVQSVYDYAQGVIDGRTIACQKVRLACERFIRDLKKSEDPMYPWRFDEAKAVRPIEFMERYLCPTKGDYDRMELMPWQRFCEANLYGWVSKETGLRRFLEGLIVVGRGNGKSTMVAGNASFGVSKDDERGADVYLLANSKEQASIVFEEAKEQIRASNIEQRFKVLRDVIRYPATGGTIKHRASDSCKLDGLNPSMAVFDELHAYQDFKLINVIKRGMNKRKQPLAIYITTMGTVLDGPLMHYYQLFADAMIEGKLRDDVADRLFTFICEQDAAEEIEQPDTWIKANPSLGVLLDLEQLKTDWERSKNIPQERADFICKQLDIFANASETKFVEWEVLKRNKGDFPVEGLVGRSCYGGFDLSSSEDFTAAALEFPLDDGRFFWLCHSWVPQKKVDMDNEKIPYYEYAMQGLLTIVPGEYVRYELIYEWFLERSKEYDIRSIGYDPANATMLVRMMEGMGLPMQRVRQGSLTLSAPMKSLKEILIDGLLVTNNDPMCRWYLDNVKVRSEARDRDLGNMLPTKAGKYKKIDGFAALLDAHVEYMRLNPVVEGASEPSIAVYSLYG